MGRGRPRTKHLTRGRPSNRVTIDRKPIRPLERQRMRPWLMHLLDSEQCKQLVWISREENSFRIAWKHAAGQTFNAKDDATLFERWARHTGKFYEGDRPDPKKWKANFRCALNSLQDVEEDKARGVKKGNDAFKVYRFLGEKRSRKLGKKVKDEEDSEEELRMLRNLGTKSRPKVPVLMELDSEGSEGAQSPVASNLSHSDWDDMGANELRSLDQEMEQDSCQKSPLPDFEKLCESANLFPMYNRTTCPQEPLMGSHLPQRLPETYSPQRPADYTFTDTDDVSSNSSSCHAVEVLDDHIIEEVILPENADPNWGEFFINDDQCYTIQEAPEQIVTGEDNYINGQSSQYGPNVIVLSETNTHDYVFTSMADL